MIKFFNIFLVIICIAQEETELLQNDSISSSNSNIDEVIEKLLNDISKVPDFTLSSYTGEEYNMRSLEGKVILLNFWATWCYPCRMEIPDLNEMQEQFKNDDFIILGISISDTQKALNDFAGLYEVKYPLLYGKQSEIDQILIDYGGIFSVPTSILINKSGEVIFNFPGAILKSHDYYNGAYSILKNKIIEALEIEIETETGKD